MDVIEMRNIITAAVLALLAVVAAIMIPHRPPACELSAHEAQPWIQEQRTGCPADLAREAAEGSRGGPALN